MEEMICGLCKKEIKNNDNYVRLTDYKQGEFYGEGFYHNKCYNDKINGQTKEQKDMKRLAYGTLAKANQMLNQVKSGGMETYEIR